MDGRVCASTRRESGRSKTCVHDSWQTRVNCARESSRIRTPRCPRRAESRVTRGFARLVTISTNITTTVPPSKAGSPIDYGTARHINALWFSSLSLALSAALVGILSKQWVRLYPLTNNLDALKAFSIRQMRHEGLASYGIPTTIASISVFLEISVILFFVGLACFTWNLDRMVAFPVLLISSLVGIFLIATTITPVIQYIYVTLRRSFDPMPSQCPWKSPQSWLLIKAWNLGLRLIGTVVGYAIFQRKSDLIERQEYPHPPLVGSISSWASFDQLWTSQNDQCDATVLAGPGAPPYLSSGLPWALEKIESPEIPVLTYHILAKAIKRHDKQSLRIFNLTRPSPEVAHRAAEMVSKSCIGNAHLVKTVIKAKGADFLHQYALEDERRVRINRTVPYCILAAFDEWATCSIHSSSCSAEFTQATLLYLAEVKGCVGVEHCARVIRAHLGHRAKGKVFPPNPMNAQIRVHEYAIPSAVHVVFSAHMAAVLDRMDTQTNSDSFSALDQLLLNLLERLLEHGVLHVNTHDEYEVSGRDFLLAHNIPHLPLHTLAYFHDIIRYFMARFSSGNFDVPKYLGRTLQLLNDYVHEHSQTIGASVVLAFQKLIGEELWDLVEAISPFRQNGRATRLQGDSASILFTERYGLGTYILRALITNLQTLQERLLTETLAQWEKVLHTMHILPAYGGLVRQPSPVTPNSDFQGNSSPLGHPDTLQDTFHPDGSHPSASHRPEEEAAANLGLESPEMGIIVPYPFDLRPQQDPSRHPLHTIEEVETPGAGTELSRLGSETGRVQEVKATDKSEENVGAHAASSNERTKLSDTTSSV